MRSDKNPDRVSPSEVPFPHPSPPPPPPPSSDPPHHTASNPQLLLRTSLWVQTTHLTTRYASTPTPQPRHTSPPPPTQCTTCVLYASSPIFPCGDLLCFLRVFVDAFVRRAAESPGYAGINGVVLREAVSQACAVASRGSDSTWEREGGVAERATEWGSMYDRCVAADLQGFASVRRVRVAGELATLSATSGGIAAAAAAVSRLALALAYTMSTVNTDAARFGSIFQDCSYPRQTQYLGDNAHGVTRITFPAPTRGSLAHAAALDLRGPLPPLAFNLILSPSAFIAHSTLCAPVRTADHNGDTDDDDNGGASALESSLVSPREGE